MPDYGLTTDSFFTISGSAYLFQSGALSDVATSTSASTPQIIAVTCSANTNNILTRLTNLGSYAEITISSGSAGFEPTTLILRYVSSSNSSTSLLYTASGDVRYIDIPIQNNDDGLAVAYKTVKAINATVSPLYTASLEEELGGIGTSDISGVEGSGSFIVGNFSSYTTLYHLSSSLGQNMAIGNSFRIRKGGGIGDAAISDGFIVGEYPVIGKFLLHSLNSGSVATPDFSGTRPEVGGMEIGSSFKIGQSSPLFSYNIFQSGSGNHNIPFLQGNLSINSSSIGITLDPKDKSSGLITGSGEAKLYMSSSGKLGFNTTNPKSDFDVRADKFRFQTKLFTKGIEIDEEGNLESFNNELASSTTGSEVILSYSRGGSGSLNDQNYRDAACNFIAQCDPFVASGVANSCEDNKECIHIKYYVDTFYGGITYNYLRDTYGGSEVFTEILNAAQDFGTLNIANAGDTIGSLRWRVSSGSESTLDKRQAGAAASITTNVATADATGVTSNMLFKVAKTKTAAPTEVMRISSDGTVHITGSLTVTTAVTASIISSSIIFSSGSNIFGDENSDLHTFTGSISCSGNISATINGGSF
tara:strand:- start:762 stop:2525 length:1764 start_codon:yes stop_codon:yes gene_type:complete